MAFRGVSLAPDGALRASWLTLARAESLPRGRQLPRDDWRSRHRLVSTVLLVHAPALLVIGVLRHRSWTGDGVAAVAMVLWLVARADGPRRQQALSATVGLVVCSAGLSAMVGGGDGARFHYLVVVAVAALYQDWTAYALVIGFVPVEHVVLDARWLGRTADGSWATEGLFLLVVMGLAAIQLLYWRYAEQAYDREASLRSQLLDGQASVMARLEQTAQLRADLIGTVSHEFRTPLTGIRAAALTLRRGRGRLSEAQTDVIVSSVVSQADRLSRLLENMLIASGARVADLTATCRLHEAVTVALRHVAEERADGVPAVEVAIDPAAEALIDRRALDQVLANLLDNALVHGSSSGTASPGSPPSILVSALSEGPVVCLAVSNPGRGLDEARLEQLFEPFTQGDASVTRSAEGAGMGLFVVRRLVEAYGGSVRMTSDSGWVTVEVRLRTPSGVASGAHGPDLPGSEEVSEAVVVLSGPQGDDAAGHAHECSRDAPDAHDDRDGSTPHT